MRHASLCVLLALSLSAPACLTQSGYIKIEASRRVIPASSDGRPLLAYELRPAGDSLPLNRRRAVIFYLQGSGAQSVLDSAEKLAGAATMNALVVVMERREVGARGEVDRQVRARHSTLAQRTSDHLSVVDDYLARLDDGTPVIVMGGSEGGTIACEVARMRPRVTQLVLLGSGGGWTQAREFRHFVEEDGSYLDVANIAELEDRFERIRNDPHSADRQWAGHSHRYWSSFLWHHPLRSLLELEIPILLLHGAEDRSVPVMSARAIAEAFSSRGKSNLTYREYDDMDHSFRDSRGRSMFPLLEIDMVRWFQSCEIISARERDLFEARVRRNHPEIFEDRG